MSGSLPSGEYRFVALDVETACGDSASICQIGLACVDARGDIETYATYVNPQMDFAPFNTQLHGIGPQTVRDAPTFGEVWQGMFPFLARHPLVQHSQFDERAIAAACAAHALEKPRLQWANSVTIARKAWPELKGNGGHGLANLKSVLDLEFQHHDAGEDAKAAAMVVLLAEERMATQFEQMGPNKGGFQLSFPF